MADCTPTMDIECELQHSPIVNGMKAKEQQLQMQINNLNDSINKSVIGPVGDKGIKQRLDDVEAGLEEANDRVDQQNTVISEIGDNISLLKGMNTRQDEKISSLQKNVIADDTYFNFEDWIENVYIPQGDAPVNKYSQGDIYMNVNPDVAATNATYVCIRPVGSTAPLSANDWQQMYYSAPADVMAILGIDPIKVTHPYKHEWVVSVDPNRLADMIGQLRTLDLSGVEVTLGEVYFEPVIKESATIQENLTVGNTTTTKELDAEVAYIDRACIRELSCDADFSGTPTFGTINVDQIEANNYHQEGGNFNIEGANVTITGGNVEIPVIEGDTHFHDDIYSPNINIENKITTEYIDVHNDAHFDGYVNIDGYLKYTDPTDPERKIICMDNAVKNLFRPSYGVFKILGNGYVDGSNTYNDVVFGLGSNAITFFNSTQQYRAQVIPHGTANNLTQLIWDTRFTTPGVEKYRYGEFGDAIYINRLNDPQDNGIYRIDFNMTIQMDDCDDGALMNVWAHRAGVVVYDLSRVGDDSDPDNPRFFIVDDKNSAPYPVWDFTYSHTHGYYDRDYDDISGDHSQSRTTDPSIINLHSPDRCQDDAQSGFRNVVIRVGNHYTYTKSLMIPVTGPCIVAPYFKPSAGCVNRGCHVKFSIPTGEWQTGSMAQVYVQKIAGTGNGGRPYEYYC